MKKWSLNAKLYFVLGLLIVSNVVAVGIGTSKLSGLNDSMDRINNSLYKRIGHLNSMNTHQLNLSIRIRDIIIASSPEDVKKSWDDMNDRKGKLEKSLSEFQAIASSQGKTLSEKYQSQFATWYSAAEEVMHLASGGKIKEAAELSKTKLAPLRKQMGETFNEIVTMNEARMTEAAATAATDYTHARNQMIGISSVLILFSLATAVSIIRAFGKSVERVIANLNENSAQVASASAQLAASSQELSQASTEQASSLEQTAASLEEISAMIGKAADSASVTATSSNESQNKAEYGRKSVQNMMTSMEEISQSNEAIMAEINANDKRMQEIVRVIRDIGDKTKVINDIVFQTKLLSFNASVEAARAGENGKGFAVVAEEVGNLAQMSGNAAKDITEMLESSVTKVEQMANETKKNIGSLVAQGKQKVDSGVNVARECSNVLTEIVDNVSRVSGLSQEISLATKEQSQGIGEINRAMAHLDTATQQNSAVSEQAAAAAEQLSSQAESLKTTVFDLMATVQGEGAKSSVKYATPKREVKKVDRVVHEFKQKAKTAKPVAAEKAPELKAVSGESYIPSKDDKGFRDV